MTETTTSASSPETPDGRPRRCRGRGRRLALNALGIAFIAALTFGAVTAFGGGMHHGFFGGGHLTSEQIDLRIDRLATWVMDDLKGTPEQREKVAQIVKAAAHDLAPVHKELKANHEKVVEILTASVIDRAELEAVRARQMELVTTASKRLTQAVADAGDQLTPDQRAALIERARSLHGH